MQKFFTAVILLLQFSVSYSQDTFSIVAVDPVTGEVGSAGASCIFGCLIISDVHPGVGAVHTQSYWLLANKNYCKNLMDDGYPPQQIIDSVVANDAQGDPTIRQYGVVDFSGSAAYTGVNCLDYKNHITGPNYSIQGNILAGQQILDSMEARFLNTQGTLACKLMAAMQGANVPGADSRCLSAGISSLSSFLRVALPGDTNGTFSLDLSVYSVDTNVTSIDPIDSLQILFDLANGCNPISIVQPADQVSKAKIFPNPANDFITITSLSPMKEILIEDVGLTKQIKDNINSTSLHLTTNNWGKGVKILKIVFEDGSSEMKKLVIQ